MCTVCVWGLCEKVQASGSYSSRSTILLGRGGGREEGNGAREVWKICSIIELCRSHEMLSMYIHAKSNYILAEINTEYHVIVPGISLM